MSRHLETGGGIDLFFKKYGLLTSRLQQASLSTRKAKAGLTAPLQAATHVLLTFFAVDIRLVVADRKICRHYSGLKKYCDFISINNNKTQSYYI